ncbi:MAG: zinc-ribbon domain-containing protein [Candidatus Pelagibacter sp.]
MMIIICENCNKKFEVNSKLIPKTGRTIQCGSCNHVWFFNKNKEISIDSIETKIQKKSPIIDQDINIERRNISKIKINNKKSYELTKYKGKSDFSFGKFLSYILVAIISFVALIIVIDTFSSALYQLFPTLEPIVFSLFETLKDIELFIKDLI